VDAPNSVTPNNTVEIEQRKTLALAYEKFSKDYIFAPKEISGNEVQSFVSFPLYSIKGRPGVQSLTDDFEIHEGMSLRWWKQYDLKDYTRKDGPELDADKDGFTNREEFDGNTDPTDADSHPDFIAKLKIIGATSKEFEMNWTRVNDEKGNFSFNYDKSRVFYGMRGVGGKFPLQAKNKSLVKRFEIKEKGQDPNIEGENGEFYLLQDNGINQNNKTFKLFYNSKTKFEDWTAILLLDIDGSRTPFNIPEGGSFSLPYDEDAKMKPYKFKSKKDNKAIIEYDNAGEKSTIELDIPQKK
jgi:hypothetical protein